MLIVFGSINMDMIVKPEHLPQSGETVLCKEYDLQPGGKGANQALAACRMGARTALVGCAGEDSYSRQILDVIRRQGVITSGVKQSENYRTGCAMIMQEANGANRIIVAAGANNEATNDQVPDEILRPDSLILTQTEVPSQEVFALIRRANDKGVKVIMNLAPALDVPEEILNMLHILVVNEIELDQVAKSLGLTGKGHVDMAHALAVRGKLTCIVTLAEKGSIVVTADGKPFHVSSLAVDVVDTTGAGDAYCGTLAACMYDGKSLEESVRWASVAGSLACTKVGTIKAFAYQDDIKERLDEIVVTK
ncbi:MAG: Ribokinase [Micavibrio sp.]|nr:Ribokinase [Micavibrio sp.]